MKKIVLSLLIFMAVILLTGCSSKNVEGSLEDITTDNIINKTKIKFSDIYEGNLEFELETDLYSLESLFEEKNIMANDVFIKFKKLENKYSKKLDN